MLCIRNNIEIQHVKLKLTNKESVNSTVVFLYSGLCRNQPFNVTSCLFLEEASVLLFLQFPFHPGLSSSNPSPSAIGAACSFIKIATLSCTTFCKIEGIGVYSLDWHVHFKGSRGRGRSVLVEYFRCFFALFIGTFLSICEPTRKASCDLNHNELENAGFTFAFFIPFLSFLFVILKWISKWNFNTYRCFMYQNQDTRTANELLKLNTWRCIHDEN